MTKAKNREETRTGKKASEATEPPWNVILHNDWHNPINRVVWRLWRTISSGGQHFGNGAEVRLYGTEQTRTLEIVATTPPGRIPEFTNLIPEIPDLQSPEFIMETTDRTTR